MQLKRIIGIMLLLFLVSISAHAGETRIFKGIYEQLPDQAFVFNGEQVEIIEFLNFYCGHCYKFEESIPVIKGNSPKKIKWKTVPLYWGKSSKAIEAFFLAEESGKGEEMKRALFKAVFVDKRDISNVNVVESIAMKVGLGFDFSHRLRAGEKAKDVGDALVMAKAYKVEETPTLIIAGNIKSTPRGLGHEENALRNNIITILKSLFEK